MTVNGELDLFSHTINPMLGILALVLPTLKNYRGGLHLGRYYAATFVGVGMAYVWMYFERHYQWWEHAWSITFSTHTAVHVAILSCLWQLGSRWRWASVAIGLSYASLILYRHYHTASDMTLTAAAMMPEVVIVWWIANPKSRAGHRNAAHLPARATARISSPEAR